MEGETIELFGDGRQRRDLNYVDDVVDALLLAGLSEEAEGEIFNLGHPQHVSLAEIANELIALTGRGTVLGVPFPPERQLTDVGNCYCSSKKIQQLLGWQPKTDLKAGLKRTIEFYRQKREHYWGANENTVSESYASFSQIV